jgi:4-amino-4-deoxy-L-arabinose transferase-like glycosyltransferase
MPDAPPVTETGNRLAWLDRPPLAILACFILAQLVLWSVLPSLVHPNALLDVIEGLTWGRDLQFGYYKHPPLQAALLDATAAIFGKGSFGFFLLSQLAVAVTYLFVWKLAREFVDPPRALLAALLESGIVYFSFLSVEFNPNVLQLPLWAGTCLYVWRGATRGATPDWLLAGLFAALAVNAKYSSVIVLAVLALFLVADPTARAKLGTRAFWLGAGVFLLLVLPNLIWLATHDFLPFHYATSRAKAPGLAALKFLSAQLLDHAGFFLLLALACYPGFVRLARGAESGVGIRGRTFLLTAAFGPVALSVALSVATGLGLRDMWGAPMFNLSGLVVAVFLAPRRPPLNLRRFVAGTFILLAVASAGFTIVELALPAVSARVPRGAFPGPAAAASFTALWREQTGRPLRFVIGSTWIAGNIAFYSGDSPLVLVDGDFRVAPWVDPDELRRDGALVVWSADDKSTGVENQPQLPGGLQETGARGVMNFPARSLLGRPQVSIAWEILRGP